ncbi:MAG TPA: cysteine desulfurase [candidate division WWE3 bacterium]|uniref:Cysteine desulfurase n=1 Tax=candidate division WWE3 bacterium TaxID=2053526 RepID=A0A7C1DIL3_UNCKA|nr:cysteine desulfurase [candidate division WWE3 bacterium]
MKTLNTKSIRKDFPILERKINGNPLVYFDNAATSQKPLRVIRAVSDYYLNSNANVHRGIHELSEEATKMYEEARKTVANFIGATSANELIFTKGTTDGINAVATGLTPQTSSGDGIIVTSAEHHSNFVPWQKLCELKGAELKVLATANSNTEFPLESLTSLLNEKTKIVSLSHASNVLGTIFPIMRIAQIVKEYNPEILIIVDAAQSVPHLPVNVQKLGCDFLAFSGHKMLGPMGIGALWMKKEHMEKLEPYEFGGGMISSVKAEKSTWAEGPEKFEAGTPNVAGAIGLAEAVKYLQKLGMENVQKHSQELAEITIKKLKEIPNIKLNILGSQKPEERTGLVSFTIEGAHPHDIAAVLNSKGIAVRAGQHCTMPLHDSLGISASTRVSFYIYNTEEEVDYFIESLKKGLKILV